MWKSWSLCVPEMGVKPLVSCPIPNFLQIRSGFVRLLFSDFASEFCRLLDKYPKNGTEILRICSELISVYAHSSIFVCAARSNELEDGQKMTRRWPKDGQEIGSRRVSSTTRMELRHRRSSARSKDFLPDVNYCRFEKLSCQFEFRKTAEKWLALA